MSSKIHRVFLTKHIWRLFLYKTILIFESPYCVHDSKINHSVPTFLSRLIGTHGGGVHKSHSLGSIPVLAQMAIHCGFKSQCCSLNHRTFDEIPKCCWFLWHVTLRSLTVCPPSERISVWKVPLSWWPPLGGTAMFLGNQEVNLVNQQVSHPHFMVPTCSK